MSMPSSGSTESPAPDEIDLRELCAAVLRHRLWVFAWTALGIALAGLASIWQKQTTKMCLLINISDGPKALVNYYHNSTPVYFSSRSSLSMPTVFATLAPVQENLDEVIVRLQYIANDATSSVQAPRLDFQALVADNATSSTQVQACTTSNSPSENLSTLRRLKGFEVAYKRSIFQDYGSAPGLQKPKSSWTRLIQYPSNPPNRPSTLALGMLGGLIVGCMLALIADRRENRVYSSERILGLLGYPLYAKLPALHLNMAGAQSEIRQLAVQINPSLSWLMLSIAKDHQILDQIVQCLHAFAPGVDLKHMPPLLVEPLIPSDPFCPLGILIVVESGFNSQQRLRSHDVFYPLCPLCMRWVWY